MSSSADPVATMLAVTAADVLSGIAVGIILIALTAYGIHRTLRQDRRFWEQREREDAHHRSLPQDDDRLDRPPNEHR